MMQDEIQCGIGFMGFADVFYILVIPFWATNHATCHNFISLMTSSCIPQGYEGILCGSCAPNYGRLRSFECDKCGSRSSALFFMIAATIWFLLVTSFLVWKALGAAKNADGTSVFNLHPSEPNEESLHRTELGVLNHDPVLLGVNPVTETAKVL